MRITRAISIRQPYAEQILRGTKKNEFRSVPTYIRGAGLPLRQQETGSARPFAALGCSPGGLPTGVIVGSVEIVGCSGVGQRLCLLPRADRGA
jgi:hypothetical protein